MNDIRRALMDRLEYSPETGEFRWRNGWRSGKSAGHYDWGGYREIEVGGTTYRAHRLAWLFVRGEWPKHVIDHINHKRDDNRIANLRDVERGINAGHKAPASSRSGVRGVTFMLNGSRNWRAVYRGKNLGRFTTKEEASAARIAAMLKDLESTFTASGVGASEAAISKEDHQ